MDGVLAVGRRIELGELLLGFVLAACGTLVASGNVAGQARILALGVRGWC